MLHWLAYGAGKKVSVMEYRYYAEQKYMYAGYIEARILTAQEAAVLGYEDGYVRGHENCKVSRSCVVVHIVSPTFAGAVPSCNDIVSYMVVSINSESRQRYDHIFVYFVYGRILAFVV